MGTHRNGPSLVRLNEEEECDLRQFIHQNPSILGPDIWNKYQDLPFLFKVLSIARPLSIQAHPDAKLAKRLHSTKPHLYPDALHKPEVAIALTDFTALCGFKPLEEINAALATYTQLQTLCNTCKVSNQQQLKEAYKSLMQTPESQLATQFASTLQQINLQQPPESISEAEKLFLQLNAEFNGDIGCFSAFFFNKISLSPGEAIVMRQNEPHAYLSGECIECMAASDNVVRAGLTPKFKDVEELVEMLTYHASGAERHLLAPLKLSPSTWEYKDASIEEFKVLALKLTAGEEEKLQFKGPSIVCIVEGSAKCVQAGFTSVLVDKGQVFFVAAGQEHLSIQCLSGEFAAFVATTSLAG